MKKKKLFLKIILITLIFIIILLFNKPLNSFSSTKNQQIIILDKDDNELLHLSNEHKITPIDLDNLNPLFIDMLLTIEDDKFYEHNGFNIPRIFKSLFPFIGKLVTSKSIYPFLKSLIKLVVSSFVISISIFGYNSWNFSIYGIK